ncbi:MAG: ATP-binding protein [Rhodoferax sp.]
MKAKRQCWAGLLLTLALALCSLGIAHASDLTPVTTHWLAADYADVVPGEYDPPPRVPALVTTRSSWESVDLPHARPYTVLMWGSLSPKADVVWYRLTVPPSAQQGSQSDGGDLHLYLPRWQTIGTLAVYDGENLIYRTGDSLVWNSFNTPLWLSLRAPASTPRYVFIRMASQRGSGSALSTAWVGPSNALQWRYRLRTWLQIDAVALSSWAFFLIGLFALAVWCVRRDAALYGVFFVTSVAYLLRSMHFTVGELPPVLSDDWFGWLTVNSLHWGAMGVFFFMLCVNRRNTRWLGWAMLGFSTALSILTLPILTPAAVRIAVLPWVYDATAVVAFVLAFAGVRDAWRSRSREGMALALVFTLTIFFGLYDLTLAQHLTNMEGVYLTPYNAIGILTIFMIIVYRRYVGAIAHVEQSNALLESRLAIREGELALSYARLRESEHLQTLNDERQRMTQDMHDGIGSSLISALRMVERGKLDVGQMAMVLQECIDDLKLSIDSLEIVDPDLLALMATLRFRLGPRLMAAGIEVQWRMVDLPPVHWLDAQNALHILRIVQEVLANIIKHTPATQIAFESEFDDEGVTVRITNNGGVPFAPPDADTAPDKGPPGRGLSNVRSRCIAIGARCTWTKTSDGSSFALWLPQRRATG